MCPECVDRCVGRVSPDVEEIPVDCKRADVKDGRRGTEDYHKASQATNLPGAWSRNQFWIDIIPGDCALGDIVSQVLRQQLNRLHGSEGKPGRCNEDREDVAKV